MATHRLNLKSKRIGNKIKYDIKKITDAIEQHNALLAIRIAATDDFTIDEEHWLIVDTLEEATLYAGEFEENECFEQWKFVGGDLIDGTGKVIGLYNTRNGKVIPPSSEGNDFYLFLPAWKEKGIPAKDLFDTVQVVKD